MCLRMTGRVASCMWVLLLSMAKDRLLRGLAAMSLLCSCSVLSDSVTTRTAACQASLSFIFWSLLKLTSTISFSVVPFSSCLQPFPASGAFPMSQFFESGGQRIGASASASVLPNWGPKGGSLWAQKETGREEQLPTSSPGNSCPKKGKFHLTLLPSCSFQTEPA